MGYTERISVMAMECATMGQEGATAMMDMGVLIAQSRKDSVQCPTKIGNSSGVSAMGKVHAITKLETAIATVKSILGLIVHTVAVHSIQR